MKPIRVALETQYAYGTPTGLGTYARKLADALRERADVALTEIALPDADVWRFDRRLVWDQWSAPRLARRARPDVTHFTGGTLSVAPPHPCVLTVHDLAWLAGAVRGRFYSRFYFAGVQRALARKADRIVADTETARAEISSRLGKSVDAIAVAGAGVDDVWFTIERSAVDPAYVLAVGTVEARKDLETAVRAIARLPGIRLVSAGMHTAYAQAVLDAAARAGVADRVTLLGYVSPEQLRSLYAGATALVFPSRYEGFGLPPLQALAARVPVVAADIPVLREVLGDCAFFAARGQDEEFADAIKRAQHDAVLVTPMLERGQMRARSFTWRSVAQRLVDVYRSLV
ncbi:MAG TPA: glycosyltransferase family 1 protein [Candidatus Acidoferrales bacterium]|nr:glycosyltransferase family 1 protein [Candidatus Acidoferrales bacterium]